MRKLILGLHLTLISYSTFSNYAGDLDYRLNGCSIEETIDTDYRNGKEFMTYANVYLFCYDEEVDFFKKVMDITFTKIPVDKIDTAKDQIRTYMKENGLKFEYWEKKPEVEGRVIYQY